MEKKEKRLRFSWHVVIDLFLLDEFFGSEEYKSGAPKEDSVEKNPGVIYSLNKSWLFISRFSAVLYPQKNHYIK